MVVVFARRVRYDQQISYCLELYLLLPACLLKPASNKEPVAKSCKGTVSCTNGFSQCEIHEE